jgi:hypothetical protein
MKIKPIAMLVFASLALTCLVAVSFNRVSGSGLLDTDNASSYDNNSTENIVTDILEESSTNPDVNDLYEQAKDKFDKIIADFNSQHQTNYAIASPNELKSSGINAQEIYKNMLAMCSEEYLETLNQAYASDKINSLEPVSTNLNQEGG